MALLASKNLKLKYILNLINKSDVSLKNHFSTTKYYLNTAAAVKIPPPQLDGEKKVYSQKIQNLVTEISKLTLIEVSDLNELLRQTLNIKDVAMFSGGGGGSGAASAGPSAKESELAKKKKQEEEDAEKAAAAAPVSVKSSFKVKLVKYDESKKVALIKEVKSLNENMNLVQAKKFIESVPQIFKDNIGKDDAEKLKAQLEKVGATCVIE